MLLGIGVDDAFILVGAYNDCAGEGLSVPERIKRALRGGGLTVRISPSKLLRNNISFVAQTWISEQNDGVRAD